MAASKISKFIILSLEYVDGDNNNASGNFAFPNDLNMTDEKISAWVSENNSFEQIVAMAAGIPQLAEMTFEHEEIGKSMMHSFMTVYPIGAWNEGDPIPDTIAIEPTIESDKPFSVIYNHLEKGIDADGFLEAETESRIAQAKRNLDSVLSTIEGIKGNVDIPLRIKMDFVGSVKDRINNVDI